MTTQEQPLHIQTLKAIKHELHHTHGIRTKLILYPNALTDLLLHTRTENTPPKYDPLPKHPPNHRHTDEDLQNIINHSFQRRLTIIHIQNTATIHLTSNITRGTTGITLQETKKEPKRNHNTTYDLNNPTTIDTLINLIITINATNPYTTPDQ